MDPNTYVRLLLYFFLGIACSHQSFFSRTQGRSNFQTFWVYLGLRSLKLGRFLFGDFLSAKRHA